MDQARAVGCPGGLAVVATVRGELQRVVRVCGPRPAGREGCLQVWWLLLLSVLSMQTCTWELGGGVCWLVGRKRFLIHVA